MRRVPARPLPLVPLLIALCCSSCQGGKPFYPVRGQVFVNNKPAEGVTIIFHPLEDSDPDHPLRPSAIVQADGSFELKCWVLEQQALKDGAPAGQYLVSCIWYPPNLEDYAGRDLWPDKLQGKYSDPKKSGLRAEVAEGPTEVPRFNLEIPKK